MKSSAHILLKAQVQCLYAKIPISIHKEFSWNQRNFHKLHLIAIRNAIHNQRNECDKQNYLPMWNHLIPIF